MFHTNSPDGYSLGIFVDENHPLFTNFPTDCFGDWQWFWPLQGARGLLINQLPAGLRPMVQPIASIDLPDRLAMFFEARVGEGRLFVSTLDLPGKADPASRALLAAVYRYVDSEAFQPETALEPEALRPYLPPLDLTAIRLDGKTALDVGGRTDGLRRHVFRQPWPPPEAGGQAGGVPLREPRGPASGRSGPRPGCGGGGGQAHRRLF